jgi:hypothetical protein
VIVAIPANTTAAANHPNAIARALCARTRFAISRPGTIGPPHTPQRHPKNDEGSMRDCAPQ